MRDLLVSDRNELTIRCARSGTDITLYYRTPTTQEEAAFNSRMIKREGNKIKVNLHAARVEFGLKVVTGFKEGAFGFDGKPISSEPASSNYREDWKALLEKGASDILAVFGQTVFEGARVDGSLDFEDEGAETAPDEGGAIEEAVPFQKS